MTVYFIQLDKKVVFSSIMKDHYKYSPWIDTM